MLPKIADATQLVGLPVIGATRLPILVLLSCTILYCTIGWFLKWSSAVVYEVRVQANEELRREACSYTKARECGRAYAAVTCAAVNGEP